MIVDDRLTVQALSRRAEAVLGIDEPIGVGVPLDELLVSDGAEADEKILADGIALALEGKPPLGEFALRRSGASTDRFRARITICGPPAAVLLILTAIPKRVVRPRERASAAGGNGTKRNGSIQGESIISPGMKSLDNELARIADGAFATGRRLEHLGDGGLEYALATVGEVRERLEGIERDLVSLAARARPEPPDTTRASRVTAQPK